MICLFRCVMVQRNGRIFFLYTSYSVDLPIWFTDARSYVDWEFSYCMVFDILEICSLIVRRSGQRKIFLFLVHTRVLYATPLHARAHIYIHICTRLLYICIYIYIYIVPPRLFPATFRINACTLTPVYYAYIYMYMLTLLVIYRTTELCIIIIH